MSNYISFDDQYFIGNEVIGKGVYGQVVKGVDAKNNQLIASSKPKLAEQFAKEIELQRTLMSPFIVQLYKVYSVEDSFMLIMEYCEGGDLEKYINKRGPIPETEALGYLLQILAGYREIHSKSAIHRDLKPSNILMKGKILKIENFECARVIDVKNPDSYNGIPYYLAPEIQDGLEYGYEVDIYSVGVLLYRLLFNSYPFKGDSAAQLYKNMQKEDIDFYKNGVLISNQMIDLLKGLLKFDRNQRINWTQLYQHPVVVRNVNNDNISAEMILAPQSIDALMYDDQKFLNKKVQSNNLLDNAKIDAEENKQKPLSQHQYEEEKKRQLSELKEYMILDILTGIKQYVHTKNIYGSYITLAQSFSIVHDMKINYQIPEFLIQKKIKCLNHDLLININERKNIFNLKFFNDFVDSEYYERISKLVNDDSKQIEKCFNQAQVEAKKSLESLGNSAEMEQLKQEINSNEPTPNFQKLLNGSLISYGDALLKHFKELNDPKKQKNLFFHNVLIFEACSIDKEIKDNLDFDFEKHKLLIHGVKPENYVNILEQKQDAAAQGSQVVFKQQN